VEQLTVERILLLPIKQQADDRRGSITNIRRLSRRMRWRHGLARLLRQHCGVVQVTGRAPVQAAVALARVGAAPFARTWPTFRPDAAFRPALPTGVAAQGRAPSSPPWLAR
jgi:hypothetical protein